MGNGCQRGRSAAAIVNRRIAGRRERLSADGCNSGTHLRRGDAPALGVSMADSEGGINLAQLSLEQLTQLKQGLESEVEALSSSYMQLRVAFQRYSTSKDTIKTFSQQEPGACAVTVRSHGPTHLAALTSPPLARPANAARAGQEMLVPLTNSLYVQGTVDNVQSLIVDVGTGYYIEKSAQEAQDFLGRKIELVKGKLAELEGALNGKRQNVEQVMMVIQQKSQQMQAAQRQQQAAQSSAGGPSQ